MELNDFYDRMREEVSEFSVGREDSTSFLIWFLENFFRLESQDAIDSVVDHTNDKGIDGIYVNDEDEIIYIFQSKFSPSNNQTQGDVDIRTFIGARQWFTNENSINTLLAGTTGRDLKSLVERKKIQNKIHYTLISVFVTNKGFDTRAKEYINTVENLETYDYNDLFAKFTYFADEENRFPLKELFIDNHTKIDYSLPDGTISKVYSIKAKELIKLEGIQDRTLFYKNVRYGVGNTRVNKSIKKTINTVEEHNNFFLYHNGITVVCQELQENLTNNKISLTSYAVINGCQSMLAFYENREKLSNNLFVLVKIIQLNLTSAMVKKITKFANNQNSISLQDLRSNDSVQKAIQNEFDELFGEEVFYRKKKGESDENYEQIIEKDFAAQLIEATYLSKPHNTHLKQKLFGEEYPLVFSKNINAEKIYFASLLYGVVKNNAELLDNEKIRNYGLSLFFFSHALFKMLEQDELGKQIIDNPREHVTTHKNQLIQALTKLWSLITPSINMDIEEYIRNNEDYFDYKNVFKNKTFVNDMCGKIKRDYIVLTRMREGDYSFSGIYNSLLNSGSNE